MADRSARGAGALTPVSEIFCAFVSTVVPEASGLDAKGWAELEAAVEDALRDRPRDLHRQLRLLLRVMEWAPVLHYGQPFTRLSPVDRARVLSYLQDHKVQLIRTGFWGLRTLAFLGYYGRSEAYREIGYAPDRRGWDALL